MPPPFGIVCATFFPSELVYRIYFSGSILFFECAEDSVVLSINLGIVDLDPHLYLVEKLQSLMALFNRPRKRDSPNI